ncbi:MAG TPA: hypothetical protein VFM16_02780, partial [Holophagaceae bacterium]|nr:hypothetical protein [Holophagaceae bacterium]
AFRTTLLEALSMSPETIAPQIATLITKYTSTFGGGRYEYVSSLDELLFEGSGNGLLIEALPGDSVLWSEPLMQAIRDYGSPSGKIVLSQIPEPIYRSVETPGTTTADESLAEE